MYIFPTRKAHTAPHGCYACDVLFPNIVGQFVLQRPQGVRDWRDGSKHTTKGASYEDSNLAIAFCAFLCE